MKKILLLISFLLIAKISYADIDISYDYSESIQSSNKIVIDSMHIYRFTKTLKIDFRKGYYDDGDFISNGMDGSLILRDVSDDPETVEDETCTDFTDAINYFLDKNKLRTVIQNRYSQIS